MHPRRLITVGRLLVGISLLLGMTFMGFLVAQRQAGELTAGGFWVGVFLMALVVSPLLGVGVYTWRQGVIETKEVERMERQRRLLGAIQAHGKIALAELAIQSGMPVEQVRDWIYDLERLGLFTGYIDWQEGVLYSAEASVLREKKACPRCGGSLDLLGKGIVKCNYCGTEIFL
jgi:ribosomal protein S27AE